jgi:cytochrome c5
MRVRWLPALLLALGIGAAAAQGNPERDADRAHAIQQPAEEETILPEGEGRTETFAYCTACHSTAIIRRSRFTRAQWDGLMDWMADTHGMNPLEGEFRGQIVDYLAQHFGPARPPARGRNPFLN